MTEIEAYRNWHRENIAREQFRRKIRDLELTLEGMQLDLLEALFRQCLEDAAFHRALRRYIMNYDHSEYGWRFACNRDGRLLKLTKNVGWENMRTLIRKVQQYYG